MNSLQTFRRTFHSRPHPWMAWAAMTLVFGAAIFLLHRFSNRNLISFHGTLHLAITQHAGPGWSIPENPFLAGEPVRYYWCYHWLAARLAQGLHLHPLLAFELLSLISLGLLVWGAVWLGKRLYGVTAAGVLMAWLALVGSNAFGWLVLVAKAVRHGGGWIGGSPDAVVGPMLLALQYGDHRFGPNLPYFIHLTSRPAALAGVMVGLLAIHSAIRSTRPAWWTVTVLGAMFGSVIMNPVIGLAAVGGIFVGLAMSAVGSTWPIIRRRFHLNERWGSSMPVVNNEPILNWTAGRRDLSRIGWVLGALVMAVGFAYSTLHHLLTGSGAGVAWDPGRLKLYAIVMINGSLLVIMAIVGGRRAPRGSRLTVRSTMIAATVLIILSCLVRLPGVIPPDGVIGNEHNLFNTAALLLAVPAAGVVRRKPLGVSSGSSSFVGSAIGMEMEGGAAIRSRDARRRALCWGIAFVPTTLLLFTAYLGRAALPLDLEGNRLRWQADSDGLQAMYSWFFEHTPKESVVIIDPNDFSDRICNVSDFPSFTERVLFVDRPTYMVEDYLDFEVRSDLARAITSGQWSVAAEDYLKRLGRPIYVVTAEAREPTVMDRLQTIHGRPKFVGGRYAAFRCALEVAPWPDRSVP